MGGFISNQLDITTTRGPVKTGLRMREGPRSGYLMAMHNSQTLSVTPLTLDSDRICAIRIEGSSSVVVIGVHVYLPSSNASIDEYNDYMICFSYRGCHCWYAT